MGGYEFRKSHTGFHSMIKKNKKKNGRTFFKKSEINLVKLG